MSLARVEFGVNPLMRGRPVHRSRSGQVRASSEEIFMDDDRAKLIAVRAYEIWESEGRQQGFSETYWLRAERELGFAPDASMMGSKPGSSNPEEPAEAEQLKAGME